MIASQEDYTNKLKLLVARLTQAISEKDDSVYITRENVNVGDRMQLGSSATKVVIHTASSGRDEYIVWVDGSKNGQFIRNIT